MASTQPRKTDLGTRLILGIVGLFGALLLIVLLRAVFSDFEGERRAESCKSDYGYLMQTESYGHHAQNSHLWSDFRSDCADELDELTAYLDAREVARAARNDCSDLEQQVGTELTRTLDAYGECDGVPLIDRYELDPVMHSDPVASTETEGASSPVAPVLPASSTVAWDEALGYAGSVQRVCGPVVSVRGDEHAVYLNIGHDHPDQRRFAIVMWDVEYVEGIAPGSTACTTGPVVNYRGVAQIHSTPEQVEVLH